MQNFKIDSRRQFIKKMIALSVAAGFYSGSNSVAAMINSLAKGEMPKRPFGKTGYNIGLFSLGAQGTVEIPGREEDALAIINRALDLGVNYIDTSAYYGRAKEGEDQLPLQGTSERYVGQVLKTRRKETFIATKTHDRSYDGAMRHLEKSLKNLQTDKIDLWQIHNVKSKEKEDIDKIFADDGVLKAMKKAKEEGIVKFLGVTGHESPDQLRILIERFPFDTILTAINAADKHHDPVIEKLLPTAVEKNVGIVAMKIPARDRIFSKGGIITMKQALEYVFTFPISTAIVGIDNLKELEENVQIAKNFAPLTEDELLAIENLTKPHYKDLQFFKGLSDWPKDW
ncbi:MAG: aldo/keto reductase [Prolixibacteraceae bacterium]|jgi:uncharacterized protein|nr:aldo/keto reductase [Prolixibacteraceae bacterium]MBT6006061.1 aldo/keto reductase [Prolixibacteraceae bacterium]MBT6999466.1 aldo/keto reductase [Prolixibacteraceae bacterium]MBT7396840.1 aldo/keto reductase [Prolixibacteraceae bacterium]